MRRRKRNISVYIDTSGSGGRGWVIHLLPHVVEEGGGIENVSTNYLKTSVSWIWHLPRGRKENSAMGLKMV